MDRVQRTVHIRAKTQPRFFDQPVSLHAREGQNNACRRPSLILLPFAQQGKPASFPTFVLNTTLTPEATRQTARRKPTSKFPPGEASWLPAQPTAYSTASAGRCQSAFALGGIEAAIPGRIE